MHVHLSSLPLLVMAATGGTGDHACLQHLSQLSQKAHHLYTLQPTSISLNFTALPFEELHLCCKTPKHL